VRIGIDLDNTIINYERAFAKAAATLGLTSTDGRGKTELRDRIRLLDAGEERWMRVQAHVYGPAIDDAVPYEGVEGFFERASARGVPLVIVSHKSEFAAAAPQGTNLRTAALRWLEMRGFVRNGAPEVFFESTRREKCERIASTGCTLFIDDLTEVFEDPAFPAGVQRWFFAPAGDEAHAGIVDRTFRSWAALAEAALP
jgi:hypothetical protein